MDVGGHPEAPVRERVTVTVNEAERTDAALEIVIVGVNIKKHMDWRKSLAASSKYDVVNSSDASRWALFGEPLFGHGY